MISLHNPDIMLWYIILQQNGDIVTYGVLNPGEHLDSAAGSILNTYTTSAAYLARLAESSITPESVVSDLPEDVAQARIIMNNRVNTVRAEKLVLDVTYLGHPFQSDDVSMANITGVLAGVAAGIPLPESFAWRAADDAFVPMDIPKLVGLGAVLMAYRSNCYVRSWGLKQTIAESTEFDAIDLSAGWPDPTHPV